MPDNLPSGVNARKGAKLRKDTGARRDTKSSSHGTQAKGGEIHLSFPSFPTMNEPDGSVVYRANPVEYRTDKAHGNDDASTTVR